MLKYILGFLAGAFIIIASSFMNDEKNDKNIDFNPEKILHDSTQFIQDKDINQKHIRSEQKEQEQVKNKEINNESKDKVEKEFYQLKEKNIAQKPSFKHKSLTEEKNKLIDSERDLKTGKNNEDNSVYWGYRNFFNSQMQAERFAWVMFKYTGVDMKVLEKEFAKYMVGFELNKEKDLKKILKEINTHGPISINRTDLKKINQ